MATVFSSKGSQLVANFYLNGSGNSWSNISVGNLATIGNLVVTGNSNLGPVGNVHIGGGLPGQVLTTDGNANLYWSTPAAGGGNIQPMIEWTSGFGNGLQFTDPNVSTFASGPYASVYVNGVLLGSNSYTITGNTLQINTLLKSGDQVTIGATGAGGGGGGNALYAATAGIANTANVALVANYANYANVANVANSVAVANVIGIGNIATINLNGNGSTVLAGNGAWVPGGGTVTRVGTIGSGLGFSLTGGNITTSGDVVLTVPNAATLRTNLSLGNVANANFTGNGNVVLAGNGAWVTNATPPGGTNTQLQFNNGGVFGGTTITYDVPSGNLNMGGNNITNLDAPVNPTDAATKQYVDSYVSGLQIKDPVNCISATNLAGTYNNGAGGVGATLNLSLPIATIDSVPLVAGVTRILVKGQSNPAENGIYIYTNTTTLTRSTDSDTPAELDNGTFVFCTDGATYAGSGHVQTTTVLTVGTSPVQYGQFSSGSSYSAGTGLVLTGSVFNMANTGVVANTYGNATLIPQITVNPQGQLTSVVNIPIGNITSVNFDGNVANVLAGDGTWVQNKTNAAGNIREIQWNDGSNNFAANNRLYISASGALNVSNDAGGGAFLATRYSNALVTATSGIFATAGGSKAAPLPLVVGQQAGMLAGYAYTGNGAQTADSLAGFATSWTITPVIDALPISAGLGPNVTVRLGVASTSSANSLTVASFHGGNLNTTFANSIVVNNTVTANGLLGINYATEDIALSNTAPTPATNLDLLDNSIRYSTVSATANITLNIRGNSTTTLSSILDVGQSTVATQLVTTGATAYGVTALQIDGVAQTIKWAGGSVPSISANSVLAYTFTTIKISAAPTYTVLGSMTRFA